MTTTRGDVEERIRQKLRSDDEYFRQLTEIRASAEPLQHRPYQPRHERVEIEAEPGVDSPVSIAASAINRGLQLELRSAAAEAVVVSKRARRYRRWVIALTIVLILVAAAAGVASYLATVHH
jgi:hypothetical protein